MTPHESLIIGFACALVGWAAGFAMGRLWRPDKSHRIASPPSTAHHLGDLDIKLRMRVEDEATPVVRQLIALAEEVEERLARLKLVGEPPPRPEPPKEVA